MSASADPTESPEWEAARSEWWEQARGQLETLQKAVHGATPGSLALETIYAPMHDMAGLAGVLGYPLLGKIARGLIETLRKGANPLTCLRIYFTSSEDGGFVIGHVGRQIEVAAPVSAPAPRESAE